MYSEFKTLFGGFISIAIKAVILLYAYLMTRIMYGKKNEVVKVILGL